MYLNLFFCFFNKKLINKRLLFKKKVTEGEFFAWKSDKRQTKLVCLAKHLKCNFLTFEDDTFEI